MKPAPCLAEAIIGAVEFIIARPESIINFVVIISAIFKIFRHAAARQSLSSAGRQQESRRQNRIADTNEDIDRDPDPGASFKQTLGRRRASHLLHLLIEELLARGHDHRNLINGVRKRPDRETGADGDAQRSPERLPGE